MDTRIRSTVVVFCVATLLTAQSDARSPLSWIPENHGAALWAQVREVLKGELAPEDPAKTEPVVAFTFKYLAKVALYDNVAIAVVGMRPRKLDTPDDDYFKMYSVDLTRKRATPLLRKGGFPRWSFLKWASMKRGEPPVGVFRYQSCTECEAAYFLAAVAFDAAANQWSLQSWPGEGDRILVGLDSEGETQTNCLFAVEDFTRGGLDDIAVWCRDTSLSTPSRRETMRLFSLSTPSMQKSLGPERIGEIQRRLCLGESASVLCK